MSRKRAKDKREPEAVPEEILAEGSGPNEVIDANPQSLVEAAQGLVEKRRKDDRKGKGGKKRSAEAAPEVVADEAIAGADETTGAAEEPLESAPADELAAEPAAEAAPAPRKKGKKGKRAAAAESEQSAAAAETADSADSDAHALAESDIALAALEATLAHPEHAGETDDDVESAIDASTDDEAAFDAAADNVAPESAGESAAEGAATAEGEAIAAVEDAVMRAEAEAELGDAEEPGEGDDLEGGELGAALPTTAASMGAAQLKNLVEALVFAADKPLTLQRLRQLTRVSDVKRLEQALSEIAADFQNRGIALQVVSGGYQFRTNTQYSVWVQQLIAGRPVRLSRAQLETLAIVAYRQPITRPEIDEIRGVDSSATLRLLLDRSLIRTLGKKEDVGRPMLYGTTKEFLDFFSLNDLRELPTLREYSELTAESRKVMTDRLGVDPDGEAGGGEAAAVEGVEGASDGSGDSPAPAAEPAVDSTDAMLAEYAATIDAGDSDSESELEASAGTSDQGFARAGVRRLEEQDLADDGEPGSGDATGNADDALAAIAAVDASAALDTSKSVRGPMLPPGHYERDGIEYDRWGQALGPVGGQSSDADEGNADDDSSMSAGNESAAVDAASDDSVGASSSETSSDDLVDASSSSMSNDDASEMVATESVRDDDAGSLETSSDDSMGASSSSDDVLDASSAASRDDALDASRETSSDIVAPEFVRDDSNEMVASESVSDDSNEMVASESVDDESIGVTAATSSDDSNEVVASESASDDSNEMVATTSSDDSNEMVATESASDASNEMVASESSESASDASNEMVATESASDGSNEMVASESASDGSNEMVATESASDASNEMVASESASDDSNAMVATESASDGSSEVVATESVDDESIGVTAATSSDDSNDMVAAEAVSADSDAAAPPAFDANLGAVAGASFEERANLDRTGTADSEAESLGLDAAGERELAADARVEAADAGQDADDAAAELLAQMSADESRGDDGDADSDADGKRGARDSDDSSGN